MSFEHRGFVRKRTICLFVVFVVLFLALTGRLVYVHVLRNQDYKDWAKRIRFRDIPIPASRGSIYDRIGRPLAVSIEASGIYANRGEVNDPERAAAEVAAVLGCEPDCIERKFSGKTTIVWLARQIDPRQAHKVTALEPKLRGVGIERDPKRIYPGRALAAHILGFTSVKYDRSGRLKTEGVEGLECVLDAKLTGREGLLRAELDARRRVIPETRHLAREPVDGKNVYLTIDIGIQHIAEVALARVAETYDPQKACAVVMDPHTGEILALANYPSYDPNDARSSASKVWRNSAVADLYEPGSTLKLVTAAAALNEGTSPHRTIADCTGQHKIKGGRIRCSLHHPFMSGHGAVDMYKIIRHSCNIGAACLAFRVGSKKLYAYEKAFGLLDRIDAGFGCEAVGHMMPPDKWRPIRLGNVGFGQGIAVTPLQMAAAYAVVANGGVYVQPRIVREIRGADGSVEVPFTTNVVRRVISRETAAQLTEMLVGCVEEGTGKNAGIPGRTVAGKTGSAQIPKPEGGYEQDQVVASFIGFAPAYSPRLVIAVVVTRPRDSHYGAKVAAPAFREIAEKALWYLKVPADALEEEDLKHRQDGDARDLV